MSQPPPYSVGFNFTTYASLHPSAPFQPAALDNELANIEDTFDGILQNLALLQRDDGALANGIVTVDSLDQATKNLIGEWNPRGAWATGTSYAVLDMVTPTGGTITYVCAVAHVSGATFTADNLLGYWQPVNGVGSVAITAASFTFSTNNVVLGRATAGAGAGEEIVCNALGRSLIGAASPAAAATAIELGTLDNVTFASVLAIVQIPGATARSFAYFNAAAQIVSTTAPIDGQLLIGDSSVGAVVGNITSASTEQIIVTEGPGTIALSLPQGIGVNSAPTFTNVSLTDLASGGVVFVGGSSALDQDITDFVWDIGNKRLGLGLANPLALLHLSNLHTGTPVKMSFTEVGGGLTMSLTNNGVGFVFAEAALPAMLVNAGRVAINDTLVLRDATGVTDQVFLRSDAADAFALRNGTTAQMFSVYNTFSSSTNLERGSLTWAGNALFVGTAKGSGGGTARAMNLMTDNTGRWQIGATSGHLLGFVDNTYDIGASGATRPRNLYLGSAIKQVGGITTSGVVGTPAIVATGRSTAQIAAVASVSTFTVGASDASFEVSANVLVTTATTHAFTVTCAYTDEGNTARTLTMTFGLVAGGVTTTSVANGNGTVPYMGVPQHIRCKAATAITIATTGTFTTVVYNVEGVIRQMA